jgi:hypothetical protein
MPSSSRYSVPSALQVKPDWPQRITAIVGVVSAMAALVAVLYTARSLETTRDGQIADRYTKAIEQLGQSGPDKIDVRLGAVFALERIMRDSSVDHPAVVDVLSAFVRVHASRPTVSPGPTADPSAEVDPIRDTPVDIEAAVAVLGRRDPARDRKGGRIDLYDTSLRFAALRGANLDGANLIGSDLAYAVLAGATLRASYLREVDLSGADLSDADLSGAAMDGANLNFTRLYGADLSGIGSLTADQLSCAHLDASTRIPQNMPRPKTRAESCDR